MPTSPASGLFRPLHNHRLQAAEVIRHEMEMPFDIIQRFVLTFTHLATTAQREKNDERDPDAAHIARKALRLALRAKIENAENQHAQDGHEQVRRHNETGRPEDLPDVINYLYRAAARNGNLPFGE